MKYYLGGPMTGYPEYNFPAFRAAKINLEAQGFEIVLPADIDNPAEVPGAKSWGDYLADDIRLILNDCMGIILLPDWIYSRGAKLEVAAGLMKFVQNPKFEFRFYKDGTVSDPISEQRIAVAWHWDWDAVPKDKSIAA